MRSLKSSPARKPTLREADTGAAVGGTPAEPGTKTQRHLVLVTPSRRYAAIVSGFQLVLPSLSWRRLTGPLGPEIGIPASPQAGPRTWNGQIAERLAGELPADLDWGKTIPVVLLPDRPQWEGGPLSASETDILFGASRRSARQATAASTAVDALGARLILRFFETGHIEIIPFASDIDIQPSTCIRPYGSRAPHLGFAFVKPLSLPGTAGSRAGAIHLDAAGAFAPANLPDDPEDLARFAGALYWDKINPALGHPFHSLPGVMLDQGGDSDSYTHAVELVQMVLRVDPAVAAWNIYMQLPTSAIGIARVCGLIAPPASAASAQLQYPAWRDLVLPLTAAIFAICSRWEVHTDYDDNSDDPFASSPFGTVRKRTIVLTSGERGATTAQTTAHDAILEHDILSLFWRTYRDDPRVLSALASYRPSARTELDRLYGGDDELR